MDFSSQVSIQEVTCPLCRELFTEPMSLDCGHSFCAACITENSASGSSGGLDCCCPVCQSRYQPWKLQFNWELGNTVEKFRKVNMSSHPLQNNEVSKDHGENKPIFCKDDEEAVSSLWDQEHQGHQMSLIAEVVKECQNNDFGEDHGENKRIFREDDEEAVSSLWDQEHQGHQMSPREEVVKECQEKIQEALNKLTPEQQEAEQLEADINEEKATWVNRMQTERERILQGFEEMRGILDREEQRELQKLEEDEVNVLGDLTAAIDQVVQQRQYLSELVSDLQRHMYESSPEMLQDMINVITRSKIYTLKKPKIVPKKLKSTFRVPDLSGMLQNVKELTEVQSYWVDLMLHPLNTLSNVVISSDRRKVEVGKYSMFSNVYPCNFSAFDVLGSRNFFSGKYYWEVDVSGKIAWILGVYSEPSYFNREKNSGFVFNPNVHYSNVYTKFRPGNGYWVIGLQNESEYNAFEDSPSSDPKLLILSMAVPPHRVGVFLDFEAGTVSFFNITNQGSLIHKFSKCRFSQTVYPYFNPWNCPRPMTLCPPGS